MSSNGLAPPIVNNTIPAFYKKDNDNNFQIKVPFIMNRAVSSDLITGFKLRICSAINSSFLLECKAVQENIEFDKDNLNYVIFNFNSEIINPKQFYKIQLAYIDKEGKDGIFSSIALIKCTNYPTITIGNLNKLSTNTHSFSYTGIYENEDASERVYSYSFNLYNSDQELIKTTGELLHNSLNDIDLKKSQDIYLMPEDLIYNKFYYIEYVVTTVNGLKISSPKYGLMQKLTIEPEINAIVVAKANIENGYVDVYLKPKDPVKEINDLLTTGDFILSRACEDDDYSIWHDISKFELYSQYPSKKIWRDFTVEQGKKYKYAVRQYNDAGLHSDKIKSEEVYVDFDHAFLTDKNRQLKIKFNSKISSFKTNIPETKIDTIGNKYPFIFRNSQVKYFEFPISGLISYYMDDENLFLKSNEFNIDFKSLENIPRYSTPDEIYPLLDQTNIATTNPTAENIQNERFFKLKVLEWLTDGNPKLFRSPTEGNYIVRLVNCSLSPLDQLGRMLHNFNCTAYEIAEFNYSNLDKYGFIDMADVKEPVLQFETIEFYNQKTNSFAQGVLNSHPAYYIKIVDAIPGSQFIFTFKSGKKEMITIGVTGSYSLKLQTEVISIEIPNGNEYKQGSLTYGYYYTKNSTFETIHNAITEDVISHQFIGERDIFKEIEYIYTGKEWVKNPKKRLLQVYSIQAQGRPVVQWDKIPDNTIKNIYPIYYFNNKYYDLVDNKQYEKDIFEAELPLLFFNGEKIDGLPQKYEMFSKIKELRINYKTMAECSYQVQTLEYIVETKPEKYKDLYNAKQEYLAKEKELNSIVSAEVPEGENFETWYNEQILAEKNIRNDLNEKYKTYVLKLIDALKAEEELKNA